MAVFQEFPKHFADGFGGRGSEVRDLRRLIGLYERWQHRAFPHGTFDAFQAALERLSSKGELRVRGCCCSLSLLLSFSLSLFSVSCTGVWRGWWCWRFA